MPHPKLLFLPGAGASPLFWRPLGERLPSEWPKTYLGWPGLGDEPPDPSVNSLDDLVAMTERAAGEGPVDVLAQSMGGVVALKLALKRPQIVRRLVLAVTAGGVDAAARAAQLHDWRETYRVSYPNAAAWIRDDRNDLTPRLGEVGAPTLLLFGDADPIAPVFLGERLAELLPNGRLVVIPGADHALVANEAAQVAPLIVQHLA
jgi:pimeloyl-ACP methyl ester carboxylesterase